VQDEESNAMSFLRRRHPERAEPVA
jgi:hypothetical protein